MAIAKKKGIPLLKYTNFTIILEEWPILPWIFYLYFYMNWIKYDKQWFFKFCLKKYRSKMYVSIISFFGLSSWNKSATHIIKCL